MKKFLVLFLIISFIVCIFPGCAEKENKETIKNTESEKENITDYDAYISDRDNGYKMAPYYFAGDAVENSAKARRYYNNNSRRCGDYIITDYEDGICINDYCGDISYGGLTEIHIPETLEDKPVVKLGGYPEKDNHGYDSVSAFSGINNCILYIPSTVKYISANAVHEALGQLSSEEIGDSPQIIQIHADEGNPYYCSEDGTLFTKDKKSLLFLNNTVSNYVVPDTVENFVPSNNIPYELKKLTFGDKIKFIDASVLDLEGCDISENYDESYYDYYDVLPPIKVKGYKGTVAEEWAEKYYQKFISLDK